MGAKRTHTSQCTQEGWYLFVGAVGRRNSTYTEITTVERNEHTRVGFYKQIQHSGPSLTYTPNPETNVVGQQKPGPISFTVPNLLDFQA